MKRIFPLLFALLACSSCAIVNQSAPVKSSDDALGCASELLGYLGYTIVDDVYTSSTTIRAQRDARVSEFKREREMDRITVTVSEARMRVNGETLPDARQLNAGLRPPSREVRDDVERIVRECGEAAAATAVASNHTP